MGSVRDSAPDPNRASGSDPSAVATPDAAPSNFQHRTRDSSATHLLESGYDIRKDVNTPTVYPHVLNKGGHGVRSPVDTVRPDLDSLYMPAAAPVV
jgi:hypothetical protein